ncbi:MAG: hypothetical protein JNK48_32680 [Bryobacterales bacterium]|nr:hypothetical protein [Bryobacterales bacterium]
MRAPRVLSYLLAAALLTAAFYALLLAYADYLFHTGTPENIRRAAELVPSHPIYALRSGNPEGALQLNPYLSEAWIDLALAAEQSQQFGEAERLFLKAAEMDRMFAPRWALANFYFRRQSSEPFWRWLRLAAERSYGDRTALFRLAWRFTADSTLILTRAIPPQPEILSLYIEFLRSEEKWEAAAEAAGALSPLIPPTGPQLIALAEALLQAGKGAAALRVWNLWDSQRQLDPVSARSLTNAAFATEPIHKGFDWRFPWRNGVSHHWSPQTHEVRITLDGRQPEHTELLEQFLPVVPAAQYQFTFQYRLERISAKAGLLWKWSCLDGTALGEAPLRPDPTPRLQQSAGLAVPPDCSIIRLTFLYHRQPGTVRPEGVIVFVPPFALLRSR